MISRQTILLQHTSVSSILRVVKSNAELSGRVMTRRKLSTSSPSRVSLLKFWSVRFAEEKKRISIWEQTMRSRISLGWKKFQQKFEFSWNIIRRHNLSNTSVDRPECGLNTCPTSSSSSRWTWKTISRNAQESSNSKEGRPTRPEKNPVNRVSLWQRYGRTRARPRRAVYSQIRVGHAHTCPKLRIRGVK